MTVIAVDGPAASGKGTLARKLARHYGFDYLDTGKLYRAVGLGVVKAGGDPTDEDDALAAARALDPTRLDDPELSGDDAAAAASKVAAIGPVRAALKDFQVAFAGRNPGAVLDGRDIGTVICPRADAKLFVTASVDIRAERRHKELLSRGEGSIYPRVLQDLKDRDARDTQRADAPLRPADDAEVLDTSDLTIEEAFNRALEIVERALAE